MDRAEIGDPYAALTVGVLLMVALVFNISMLPYPNWFKLANLLVIPVAVFAGSRLAGRLPVNPPVQSRVLCPLPEGWGI